VKLYDLPLSPFAARVRIQIYAKGLDIPRAEPPGGLGSEAYRGINPIGKVPALVLDDGSVLPESTVIGEYLEDRFPTPPLRPAEPAARARMRLLVHFTDLYLVPPIHSMTQQFLHPEQRDAKRLSADLAELAPRYDQLAGLLAAPYAAGGGLTLADCALFPLFFTATRLHPMLGDKDPIPSRPALAAWWEGVRTHPAVAKVDAEMAQALAAMMGAAR
jgi:glutathione S-transferase